MNEIIHFLELARLYIYLNIGLIIVSLISLIVFLYKRYSKKLMNRRNKLYELENELETLRQEYYNHTNRVYNKFEQLENLKIDGTKKKN